MPTLDPATFFLAAAGVPAPIRGAALLGLVLVGGVVGVLAIVLIAWSRRNSRRRTVGGAHAGRSEAVAADAWVESARRVRVDPEAGETWPPSGSRDPSP
jgi:hypothetical protein